METWTIGNHTLEFLPYDHLYLCDGVLVRSITQVLKFKFGGMYDHVNKEVLKRASEAGTAVHDAIEHYCKDGTESDYPELRNFKFLQKRYGFEVLDNEVPVILFRGEKPICAGRLDMVIKMNDQIGLADIKRTSTLNKEYLGYQLNLYRLAYQQCYGTPIEFLRGIHLREDTRKFVPLPINEDMTWEFIDEYERSK